MFGHTMLQTLFLASVLCQINLRGSRRKLQRGNSGSRILRRDNLDGRIAEGFEVGSSATNRLYPFMARMVMDGAHKCGGSVISERIIATSRHCLRDCPCFPKQDWHLCPNICFIKLRETSDSHADTETIHTIEAVHLPENSGAPDNFEDYFSSDVTDFALVQLTRSVNDCEEMSSSRDCWPISPVHLVGPETIIRKGDNVRTIGWGATFWEESSEFLQQLNLKINSNSKFEYIMETDITPAGGDACSGDSGGPLLIRNKKTYQWMLVATLLGGGHNCEAFEPLNPEQDKTGDWNKVTPHLKWIERVVSSTASPTTSITPTTTISITGIMLNPVVLLTGGVTPTGHSVEVYSPLGSCNKDLEDIPYTFIDHSMNFFNGEIIICGGQKASTRCLFLDQNQRFIEHSKLHEWHIYHVGAVVSDTLIIVGGQALPFQGNNTVETWNGSQWEKRSVDEIEDMQTNSCIDAISKDTLLMVGGLSDNGRKYTNKMLKYYKADKDHDGVWEQMEDFPGPESYGLGCAFIKTPEGDSFLIAGGSDYKKTSYLYNIQKNKWEEVGRLSHARLGGKIVVADGKVLMLGGSYGPTIVEEYNVESKTWSQIEQRIKQSRGQFEALVVPGALVGC